MELDPYLAGAAFLVPSQLVVSGRATPSKALVMRSVNREKIFAEKISESSHHPVLKVTRF
jgi:hypothetical protein